MIVRADPPPTHAAMTEQPIVVFTDGAAKRNPGPGGWGVVIVTPDGHVTELGGGAPLTTNNKMELSGAIPAFTHLQRTSGPPGRLHGLDLRHPGHRAVGAQLAAARLEDSRGRRGAEPRAVGRAVGSDGGAGAALDRVALRARTLGDSRQRARRRDRRRVRRAGSVPLYDGPLVGYGVAILDIPDDTSVPARSASSSGGSSRLSKGPALLVSQRRGRPADAPRHLGRVRAAGQGRSGARFKKATSAADQAAVLRSWGFQPGDV